METIWFTIIVNTCHQFYLWKREVRSTEATEKTVIKIVFCTVADKNNAERVTSIDSAVQKLSAGQSRTIWGHFIFIHQI